LRAKRGLARPFRARSEDQTHPIDGGPEDQASERNALSAARQGDLRAWEWLVRHHQELVFRSAYIATRDSTLAEGVTRDVLTRAHRSIGSMEDGARLRPWLLRLTDTIARTRLRELANRRDERMPEPDPCPRTAATPVRLGAGTPRPTPAEHAALVEAFDGLIDENRITIAARYAFGLDRESAAARLGDKPDTLDQRLSASLARLRRRAAEVMAVPTIADPRSGPRPSTPSRLETLRHCDYRLGGKR
jgi:DNA-directed RNA polymerase specialized sigma24 family protein